MVDLLFVYGTLMQDFQSEITQVLRNKSELIGEGWTTGRLYDIGSYPGLVYESQGDRRVRGEIYRMYQPELLLPVLDYYEMIDPETPAENEYKRTLLPITRLDQIEDCWTYIFQQPVANLPEISSGDYRTYFSQNPNHQDFIDKN
ncbi:MAG: gamma-glutamylcyclotransferase [Saprospiraceae bacterium]|nr:gamma-glutamylcyclotransferase [Saprospiraceae bacterium]